MNFAIKDPGKTGKLIVVDIMPKVNILKHDNILEGMKSLDLAKLQSRSEAEQILSKQIPNADERQFIMKNLARNDKQGFEWKINLAALDENAVPACDREMAARLVDVGAEVGAMTPDQLARWLAEKLGKPK